MSDIRDCTTCIIPKKNYNWGISPKCELCGLYNGYINWEAIPPAPKKKLPWKFDY